jgi:hypothetical protein
VEGEVAAAATGNKKLVGFDYVAVRHMERWRETGGRGDSNPRYEFVHSISNRALSATQTLVSVSGMEYGMTGVCAGEPSTARIAGRYSFARHTSSHAGVSGATTAV